MGLFDKAPVTVEPLFDPTPAPAPNPYSEKQTTMTSTLGALAQQRYDTAPTTLDHGIEAVRLDIEQGREEMLRRMLDERSKDSQIQAVRRVQSDVLINPSDPDLKGLTLKGLIEQEHELQNKAEDPNALEKEAIKRIQEMPSDTTADQIRKANAVHSFHAGDNMAKVAIWNREADKLEQEYQHQGAFRSLLDFFTLPLQQAYMNSFSGPTKGLLPGERLHQTAEQLWALDGPEFEAALPVFFQSVRQHSGILMENRGLALDMAGKVYGGVSKMDEIESNFNAALDVSSLPFATAAKMMRSSTGVLMAAGKRGLARNLSVEALTTGSKAQDGVEAVANALPNIAKPTSELIVGLNDDIAKRIEALKSENVAKIVNSRLTPEQKQEAVKAEIERIETSYGEKVKDMRYAQKPPGAGSYEDYVTSEQQRMARQKFEVSEDDTTGLQKLHFYLGNDVGYGGFSTEEIAAARAKDYGLDNAEITKDIDNQFYIKTSQVVRETGIATPGIDEDQLGKVLSGVVFSPDHFMARVFTQARIGGTLARGAIEKEIFKPKLDTLKKLSGRGRKNLEKVLTAGQDEHKWYNIGELASKWEQLRGRGPTGDEVVAYYGMKEASDAAEAILNRNLYVEKARRGLKTFNIKNEVSGFDTGRVTGRVVDKIPTDARVLELETGIHGKLDSTKMNKLISGLDDYVVVELETPHNYKDEPVKYIFAPRSQALEAPLEYQQLESIPGGPRDNYSGYLIKQAHVGKFADGEVYHLDPIVHAAAENEKVGRDYVNRLEAARQAWNRITQKGGLPKDSYRYRETQAAANKAATKEYERLYGEYKTARREANAANAKGEAGYVAREKAVQQKLRQSQDAQKRVRETAGTYEGFVKNALHSEPNLADRLIIEGSPIGSYDRWKQLVESGQLRTDTPFELTWKHELPTAYKGDAVDWINKDKSGLEAYWDGKGRTMYSKNTETVRDTNGNRAVLSPYKSLSRAIGIAKNTAAFSDYNRLIVEDWSRFVLQNDLVNTASIGFNKDPYNVFFHGVLKKEGKQEIVNSLEANRDAHLRFLKYNGPDVRQNELLRRRFADWVDDKGAVGEYAASKALNPLSTNPVQAIRGFIFDAVLGFWDIGQLLIQSQTALAAVSIHPVFGMRAAATAIPMTLLMKNRNPNLLDYIAKNLKPVHGFEPEEFKQMITAFRNAGWSEVGGEMVQLDAAGNSIGGSSITQAWQSARQYGRVFFNRAELYNRMTAYQIAWKDVKREIPDTKSKEFRHAVNVKTNDLTFNMLNTSKAVWQEGPMSVPTQFMAYMARMLEAMLPKKFGGNPRLSGAQRARLVAGQMILYGAAGVPMAGFALDHMKAAYASATGELPNEDLSNILEKGFIDKAINSFTDADTNMASRVGIGAGLGEMWSRMSSGDLASPIQFAGGATINFGSNLLESTYRLARYFNAEQTAMLSKEEWQLGAQDVIVNNINSLKRGNKAYWVWKAGQLRDPKTGETVVTANDTEGYMALLGIPLSEEVDRWDMIHDVKKRKDLVNEISDQLSQIRRKSINALSEGDDKSYEEYLRIGATLMQPFRGDYLLQQEIVKSTNSKAGYRASDYEHARQQYEQIIGDR